MKKMLMCAAVFVFSSIGWSYFDSGLSYTSGTDGYRGNDAYAKIGTGGLWVKPEYSSYQTDSIDSYKKYSARVGFEKSLYTVSFLAGLTPKVKNGSDKYENKFAGADITFSLNPTSAGKKRMAGPNSGYGGRSASGVTQIDLAAALYYTAHTSNSKDLAQLDWSFFAGAKFLMAQISASYTASSYDKTLTVSNVGGLAMNERVNGLISYLVGYPKSNVNVKLDLLGYPMVTPFISYNKTKFKLSNTNDDLNTYGIGAYLDFNMIGATVSWQTYKIGSDRKNFLSFSAGLSF